MSTGSSIIYQFPSDSATFAAQTNAPFFPVINLKHPYPGRSWRSTASPVSVWVKCDLGAATGITYVLIAGANFRSYNPLSLNVYATNDSNLYSAFTSENDWNVAPGVFIGNMIRFDRYAKLRFNSVSYRYWISFHNYTILSPPPYDEVGRLILASHLQLTRTHKDEWSDSIISTSTVSQSGSERIVPVGVKRPMVRKSSFDFIDLAGTEMESIRSVYDDMDVLVPFFIDPFPDDAHSRNLIYGVFSDSPQINRSLLDRSNVSFTITEVR